MRLIKLLRLCFFRFVLLIIGSTVFSGICFSQFLIVALGDSLTEGFGVKKEEAYPFLVEKNLLSIGHAVKVVNAGISGSTSASALSRIKWHIRSRPDIIIIALGGNDGLRGLSVAHMKKNLSKAIELAQAEKIKVLLAGMQMPLNYGTKYTETFRDVFYELAELYNLPIVPFLLKDVGGEPSLNQPDGIHPNPEGHKIIALTVLESLEQLLPEIN